MVDALLREVDLRQKMDKPETPFDEKIETIYFGGGTPSILEVTDIERLLQKVRTAYTVAPQAEITLEANPDDITVEKARRWKEAGINRLSIGIQSFREEDLLWMNRAHNSLQARQCIDDARSAGIENISIDLIFGVPGLSQEQWRNNVETAIQHKVPHVAAYALTVEPRTALDKMIALGRKENVDADVQADQFLLLMSLMQQGGYEHYEISNFALPAYRSRHNSSYWQYKKYVGIGPGAHSFNGESRMWNVANNPLYIQAVSNGELPCEVEHLTADQKLNEYIMISLRTIEGLHLNKVSALFGAREKNRLLQLAQTDAAEGNILLTDEYISLTQKGKTVADGVSVRLFK